MDKDGLDYDSELIKLTSPETLAILEIKTQRAVEILKKLFKFPLLSEKTDPDWKIRFQREFHMTSDANLFNEQKNGYTLFEGKMIHQFTNQYLEPNYWIEPKKGEDVLHQRQKFRVVGEMKKLTEKKEDELELPEIKIDSHFYRLGWRDITNAVDYRTMICTILPPNVFLGQTISYLRPNYFDGNEFRQALSLKETLYLCGIFNSLVLDFIIRHRVGLHATMSIVYEMPIPRLQEGDQYFSEIVNIVGKLICVSPEYDELKEQVGIKKGELDPKERENLNSQMDAYVAKIYGLMKDDLEYIMGTFRLVSDSHKSKVLENFLKL